MTEQNEKSIETAGEMLFLKGVPDRNTFPGIWETLPKVSHRQHMCSCLFPFSINKSVLRLLAVSIGEEHPSYFGVMIM